MIGKFVGLTGLLLFALIMWAVTSLIKRIKGDWDVPEKSQKEVAAEPAEPKEPGTFERYCNHQKNDSRRQLANYILIHEKAERKKRGQE